MNVVITGATGFIGRYLVEELFVQGNRLTLLGRNIEKLRSLFNTYDPDLVSLVETEYDNDLGPILEGVDALVHLSGLRWLKDKMLGDYIENNVIPTENLFSASAASGINNIVFMSSIAVYNPRINFPPFVENVDCFPPTHYGVSKLLCEKIGSYYNSEFGMKIKSLRVGQVVGSGEREGFMLSEFVKRAMSRETLTVFGDGSGARDYVYVADVISAIVLALGHADMSGMYNISLGKPVTHLQLAETINHAFDNSGNLMIASEKPQDKNQQWMSCELAWKEMGWQPQWDLEDMLANLANKLAG